MQAERGAFQRERAFRVSREGLSVHPRRRDAKRRLMRVDYGRGGAYHRLPSEGGFLRVFRGFCAVHCLADDKAHRPTVSPRSTHVDAGTLVRLQFV